MKKNILLAVAFTVLSALPAFAAKEIHIGGKFYTEQYILPELAKLLLEKEGYKVNLKTGLGTNVIRKALETEQLDLYYEYTGSSYVLFHGQSDMDILTNEKKLYDYVKEVDEKLNIVWLEPLKFDNTYAVIIRRDDAEKLNIKTLSDYAKYQRDTKKVDFALEPEFFERPDGVKGLMETYDYKISRKNLKVMNVGLTYVALKEGKVFSALGFLTDGRIEAFDFVSLDDDKNFFPVYNPAPNVSKKFLEENPEVVGILNRLADVMTIDDMRKLNAAVDVEKRPITEVCTEYLKEKGLI